MARGKDLCSGMETKAEIAHRWRYLRQLLHEQLARFEAGSLHVHAGGEDVSANSILRLKGEIDEFDRLIEMSEHGSE